MVVGVGNDGRFQRRAVRRRREGAVEPADRRVEIVEAAVGQIWAAISAPMPKGAKASSTISSRPVLATDWQDRVDIERGDGARVDELDRDALGGELLAGFQRLMHHQRQGDDRDVACPRERRPPGRSRIS